MAATKSKRSLHRAQALRARALASAKTKSKKKKLNFNRRLVKFPQVKGKKLEGAEFSTRGGSHSIEFLFEDKTALSLGIEPGFTLFADYADWKTGNWRPIKNWRPVRSRLLRE